MSSLLTAGPLEGLQKALDRDPRDWLVRAVLADYLEEDMGDLLAAECVRWTFRHQTAPSAIRNAPLLGHTGTIHWMWSTWRAIGRFPGCRTNALPDEVFSRLPGEDFFTVNHSLNRFWWGSPVSRRAAEEAAIAAWKAAREAGWVPRD